MQTPANKPKASAFPPDMKLPSGDTYSFFAGGGPFVGKVSWHQLPAVVIAENDGVEVLSSQGVSSDRE